MWYLQTDTFVLLAVFSLLAALLRKFAPKKVFSVVLPLLELAALWYISRRLCVFYIGYTVMGIVFAKILRRKHSKFLFVLFCLLALVPFFLSRTDSFGVTLPFIFVSIGISFAMLKIIDVYYYVYYAEQDVDPLIFMNFMLLLPVLTSGPNFRYRDFVKTHENPLKPDSALFILCFKRIVRGMFKKVVISHFAVLAMTRLMEMSPHWYVSLCAIICSYVIVYFDLSGYSDIAISFGKLAGYDVPENFKEPWKAASFTQFWRSWHITLSNWIREHIYVVIGRRKLSRGVTALIAFFTMIIMALWHGFNLPFLLAGVYNGALLAIENLLEKTTVNRKKTKSSVYYLRCLCVNLLFAANTLVFTLVPEQVISVLRGLISP